MIKLDISDFEAILVALSIAAHAAPGTEAATDFDEMADDLREQWHRNGDEWGWPDDATPAGEDAGRVFFDLGAQAREMTKARTRSVIERPFADTDTRCGSLAQDRRDARMMGGTITANISNDPIDW